VKVGLPLLGAHRGVGGPFCSTPSRLRAEDGPAWTERLLGRRVEGGLLDDFSIDEQGDTTDTTIGIYRIESGRLKFVMPITPPEDLLARK
jgi:hypothetical protein